MKQGENLKIAGMVDNIVYRNEKNGYTVLEIFTNETLTTAVGVIPWVSVGEEIELFGLWGTHPNFGKQFIVKSFKRYMPSTSKSIFKYLSSGVIRGIGEITAQRLVDAFKDNTLNVIQNDPELLMSIKGITKSKAKKISEQLQDILGIRELMLQLSKYGLLPEEVMNIFKVFGEKSIQQIEINPYCICEDPILISFEKADFIAMTSQLSEDNFLRIKSAIIHILKHNMQNGHTCLPKDKLVLTTSQFLNVNIEKVESAFNELADEKLVIKCCIFEKEFVFTNEMHECETYSAARLLMMLKFPPRPIKKADELINNIEQFQNISYASLQKKAMSAALKEGILVLTGGPGTGKTTTLKAIIDILEENGEKVFLAAPTGRAAQRMEVVTGREAKTIHRMLEVEFTENKKVCFKRNERNLLKCDAVILDELSMIDSELFQSVLRALPLGCRFIMVGDSNQLPSVGAGNVLEDLIKSDILPVVELKEIFRQSMKSLIVTNSHKIVAGEMPELLVKNNDFFFIDSSIVKEISAMVVDLFKRRLPKAYNYSPFFDIQVICPSKKGELGTKALNVKLQEAVNPPANDKREININGTIFREDDKVMQMKNNYDITWTKSDGTLGEGIFNGDVGILTEINKAASTLMVRFEDKIAIYDMESAADLEISYAITVHKSQGNEFEAVIMPIFNHAIQLSFRNLLYTAVTRAKAMIVMVGSKKTVLEMVQNNKKSKRYSGLNYFLKSKNITQ